MSPEPKPTKYKNCHDCGTRIEHDFGNRRYCPPCRARRARAHALKQLSPSNPERRKAEAC